MRLRRFFEPFVLVVAVIALAAACQPAPNAPGAPAPPPDIAAAIDAHFADLGPGVVGCMTGIAWRESGYVETAGYGKKYLGLFQIDSQSQVWPNMAFNLGRPLNPFLAWDNAAAARSLFDGWRQHGGTGFEPWRATRGGC